jgi:tetratricopeptide (TPR) repeat protein
MMHRRIIFVAVCFLMTCLAGSVCLAQSSKIKKLSTGSSGVSVGSSTSIGNFRAYSAGASSYGNLYQAPEGGGALSSSIQQINRRAALTGNPASAFSGQSQLVGSSTKNIAAGAMGSMNLNSPMPNYPAAGNSASVLGAPGIIPSTATDKSSAALFAADMDAMAALPMPAVYSGQAYADTFGSSESSKAGNDNEGKPLTTLVPKSGGTRRYRQLLRTGEEAFRKEDYRKAAQAFGIANEISSGSSDSLLSLLHLHFATARNRYNVPSYYLQRLLREVPELPLIPVHPRDFYGNVGTFVQDMIRLEQYTKAKPKDANAQLMLAYVKWREKNPNQAAAALRKALENSKDNEELIDAIQTLWKGMVRSGAVSGTLESGSASEETVPLPMDSPVPEEPLLPSQ